MEIDDLIGAPSAGSRPEPTVADHADVVARVRERSATLDRAARARDLVESAVALLMLPTFTWLAVQVPSPVSKAGAALIAAACVLIPVRFRAARGRPIDPALPVVVALAAERARLEAQAALLRSIAWWYLGPLLCGVALFLLGAPLSPMADVVGALVIVSVGVVLHRANVAAVHRDVDPQVAHITKLMEGIDEP